MKPFSFKHGLLIGFCWGITVMGLLVVATMRSARAAETWADFSTTSWHAGGNSEFNSRNFGLGVSRQWGDKFVMAGRYSNSLGTQSRYALVGWTPLHVLGADVGAVAGLLDGYDTMRNGHAFVAAGGIMRWTGRDFGAQLMFFPPIKGSVKVDQDGGTWTRHETPAAVGLQLRWRFK